MFQFLIDFFYNLLGISKEEKKEFNGNHADIIRTYRTYYDYSSSILESHYFNCDSCCPYFRITSCNYECMDPTRGYNNSFDNRDLYYDYEFCFDIDRDDRDWY